MQSQVDLNFSLCIEICKILMKIGISLMILTKLLLGILLELSTKLHILISIIIDLGKLRSLLIITLHLSISNNKIHKFLLFHSILLSTLSLHIKLINKLLNLLKFKISHNNNCNKLILEINLSHF